MKIEPARIDQIQRGKNGKLIVIESDVGNVAADLQEYDPKLRVEYSEIGEYFVVYRVFHRDDGSWKEELVLTAQDLDQRIVSRVKEIDDESYNYADELEKADRAADKEADHALREEVGEIAERAAHALRKDLGYRRDADRVAELKRKGNGKN